MDELENVKADKVTREAEVAIKCGGDSERRAYFCPILMSAESANHFSFSWTLE
jgi:hypothetical protein